MSYLEPATEYIFMVAAVNDAGESDISNILSAKTFDAGMCRYAAFVGIKGIRLKTIWAGARQNQQNHIWAPWRLGLGCPTMQSDQSQM